MFKCGVCDAAADELAVGKVGGAFERSHVEVAQRNAASAQRAVRKLGIAEIGDVHQRPPETARDELTHGKVRVGKSRFPELACRFGFCRREFPRLLLGMYFTVKVATDEQALCETHVPDA